MVVVREVAADEWELVRDVRLAALKEAPYAFGSTYEREAAFAEPQWRRRFSDRAVTLLAHVDAEPLPAGLAGVYVDPGDGAAGDGAAGDGAADLVSMWVRPAARGRGVGEALVAAAAGWARARDHPALFLWVTETNLPARALYERCGFTPTGERQPLPSDPALPEIRMRRAL